MCLRMRSCGVTLIGRLFVLVVYFASDEDLAIIHHIGDEGKKE